jgi:Zn-dependent oligopeptidase
MLHFIFVFLVTVHQLSADRERQALETFVKESGTDVAIEAWDWRYYAEKVQNHSYENH